MSDDRYTVVQRGLESSGRPCKETKFAWQCIDRVNEVLGGKMVVIQGSFMAGIGASAFTMPGYRALKSLLFRERSCTLPPLFSARAR